MLRCFLCLYLFTTSIFVNVFAQDSTYRGREFWAGYGLHQFMESPNASNLQELVFYISTQQDPAIVTITIDSSNVPWSRTYNIPANSVIVSDFIPKSGSSDARLFSVEWAFGGTSSSGMFRRKGIHIQSDVPIAVYSHIYGSASSGASLLLPVNSWGYTYQSMNSKQQYAPNCYSWVYIIASEDNTSIEIKPSVLTKVQDFTGLQPGVAKIISLHKGQIYQILGANTGADANGWGGNANTGFELTGTAIRSLSVGKPIAVFSGSSRTINPATCGTGGGDNDMVQAFPLHFWGKKYLTAPTSASTSASYMSFNIYKILVNDPQTVVRKNGVVLSGLVNNNYYLFESNTPAYIEADQPVMIAQFMTAGASCTSGVGDPDMYYLSPMDAGVKKLVCVRTTKEAIAINYVTLIIPTAGINSLLIDGISNFSHSYVHPSLSGYSVVVKSWTSAISQFTIESDSAFTGIAYGMGSVESYGYNLGANFKPNNGLDPFVPMVWKGAISTDWFNAANWSTVHVPTAEDHVRIPSGTAFSPIIADGLVGDCKSITVENLASINVLSNAKLNVTGK